MPASARILVDKMLEIATFDIIESEAVFGVIIDFPEEDEGDIKGSFAESGYESAYMINLLGIGFIIMFILFIIMFILLLTYPLSRCFAPIQRAHTKVARPMFWSIWIRFLMEESLIIFFSVFCDVFKANAC